MTHQQPLLVKQLTPSAVEVCLERDGRLIVPVGTTEQHGPHLPLGCDTIIVERLADDLSAEFQVLRAPTIEYGVNAPTGTAFSGTSVRRKTLLQTVDIFAVPLGDVESSELEPIHGGEIDTSLMLFVDPGLAHLDAARDYAPGQRTAARYYRGVRGAIPDSSPGSLGSPSTASPTKGERIYRTIYQRVAARVSRRSEAPAGGIV